MDPTRSLKASTRRTYHQTLRAAVRDLGTGRWLSDITREDLEDFLSTRWDHTSPATWNRHVAVIGSFFSFCVDQKWLTTSPARKIERRQPQQTSKEERQQQVLGRDNLERLLTLPSATLRDRLLWRMLYDTTAQASAILTLDVEDLDQETRQAVIHRKGTSPQRIYWTSATSRLLTRYLAGRRRGPLFLTHGRGSNPNHAASSDRHGKQTRLSYRRAEEILRQASGATLHQLRHTALTHLVETGEDITLIRAKSHHSSLRSLERYTQPIPGAPTGPTDRRRR